MEQKRSRASLVWARGGACAGGAGLLALLLVLLAPLLPARGSAAKRAPRLVLVVVVDQLRADRLHPGLPGGLGRLLREGRSYPEAVHDHAMTETCPGHAALATGRHPGATGIPGNEFFDETSGAKRYCVADAAPDARVLGAAIGRSPRSLRATALGDWLRAASPASRVYSVSGKDRAAVVMGGRRPNGAYWFLGGARPGFTTSLYYRAALPAWVQRFNGSDPPRDGFWPRIPSRWYHAQDADRLGGRPDDFAGESKRFGRSSGHPLDGEPARRAARLATSPFLDQLTLDFALRLVEAEELGRDSAPDLLLVSLSGTDLIGHHYGPFSHEAADALERLDAALGDFLSSLEARLGAGQLLVALSSDHGVLPLPEWLAARGQERCPVSGGRVGLRGVALPLLWKLHWRNSPFSLPGTWLHFAGSKIRVDRERARSQGVSVEEVAAQVEAYLEGRDAVAEVWSRAELRERDDPMARLYRNSFDAARSGDLAVQVAAGCLFSGYETGTSHGTPYNYDRAVPLLFWGPGIAAARVPGAAATVDLAPTLARRLGLVVPPGLDGRALFD